MATITSQIMCRSQLNLGQIAYPVPARQPASRDTVWNQGSLASLINGFNPFRHCIQDELSTDQRPLISFGSSKHNKILTQHAEAALLAGWLANRVRVWRSVDKNNEWPVG